MICSSLTFEFHAPVYPGAHPCRLWFRSAPYLSQRGCQFYFYVPCLLITPVESIWKVLCRGLLSRFALLFFRKVNLYCSTSSFMARALWGQTLDHTHPIRIRRLFSAFELHPRNSEPRPTLNPRIYFTSWNKALIKKYLDGILLAFFLVLCKERFVSKYGENHLIVFCFIVFIL